jgi:hypothetical protein
MSPANCTMLDWAKSTMKAEWQSPSLAILQLHSSVTA